MDFSIFTVKQKEDYEKVQKCQARLEDLTMDGTFTLKPEVAEIMNELEEIAAECKHAYENGQCVICGAPELKN